MSNQNEKTRAELIDAYLESVRLEGIEMNEETSQLINDLKDDESLSIDQCIDKIKKHFSEKSE